MPDLTPPAWDDKKRMPVWVNAMLDVELEAAIAAANSVAAVNDMTSLVEPIESLLEALSEGTANSIQQWRAADLIRAAGKRRRTGPKKQSKMDRDALLAMAAQDARRITQLWREHFGKPDLPRAAEMACARWINRYDFPHDDDSYDCAMADLTDRVMKTLRRPRARNFGVR